MAVTTEMIAVALGQAAPLSGSVMESQWQMWIADANMLIDDRMVELGIDQVDEAKRDYVVRQAVVAHVQRPDDATQVTVSVDDAASTKTYRTGKGRVSILDEWWALLGLTAPNSGAYAFDMLATGSRHLPWCTYSMAGTWCSCGVDIAGKPIFETE